MERINGQNSDLSGKNGGGSFVDDATMAMFSSSSPNLGYVAPVRSGAGAVQTLSGEHDILPRFAGLEIGSSSRTTPALSNANTTRAFSISNQHIDWSLDRHLAPNAFYRPGMRAPVQTALRYPALLPQNMAQNRQANGNGATRVNFRYPSGYLRKPRFAQDPLLFAPINPELLSRIPFLNHNFSLWNSAVIDQIFSEIKDCIPGLMVHQDGSNFIQNFFTVCDEDHMEWLLSCVLGDERRLLAICEDPLGTRAVQKMLEHLKTPRQRCEVLRALKDHTITLSNGVNSNLVINKCLTGFSSEETKDIQRVLAENCLDLATDKNGCVVLQVCALSARGEHRDRILAELAEMALILSEHSFGNYVVSHLVREVRLPFVTAEILSQLKGNYVFLSMNKHASNVVEECLRETQGPQQAQIIIEIMNDPNFLRVLQDPYGNYVAQTALKVSPDSLHRNLVDIIRSYSPFLQSHPHGKKVLTAAKGCMRRI